MVAVGRGGAAAGWGVIRWRCRRLTLVASGLRLVPRNFERKLCPVQCWTINDGACGRRSPPWRRCCDVLGDVVPLPHLCGIVFLAALLVVGRRRWGGCSGVELRRKSMPVCRPMMATPSGAVFLLGGIIRSLHSPAAPHGWSPDRWFILHTCLAPFALSPWKPRSWRMLCRLGSMSAFTCRWWFVGPGGCVAAVFVLLGGCFATHGYFEFGGCFAAVSTLADTLPPWLCFSVDAFSTVSCFVVAIVLCAGLALRVATVRASCLEGPLLRASSVVRGCGRL